MPATRAGLFVTFEGGDGAGKTTQAEALQAWLESSGHTVCRTREPGGTAVGQNIRNLLLHTDVAIDPKAEALLYAADRAQHVAEIVRPALSRGEVVVQDRYIDSSLAYQGAGRVLNTDEVLRLSEWATGTLWPDLTVLLDIDPAAAASRMAHRGESPDRLEREAVAFHTAVREGFLALAAAHPERYLIVDATSARDVIQQAIRERLAPLLPAAA
ncbi:dTMP kinase [Leucobacter sp. UCMA 4100]|uniref:dTMP kinase n=1 Tax=Leucobacter sp. UCMA 4100 TaxID=2810534 RepID=UPI0022EBA0E3|nr:dTMP kinase [Leucobacter sp. UCMA 4100]MDA3147753.1 dTMP kinase [Leucobacter sp. UCMA 4100]